MSISSSHTPAYIFGLIAVFSLLAKYVGHKKQLHDKKDYHKFYDNDEPKFLSNIHGRETAIIEIKYPTQHICFNFIILNIGTNKCPQHNIHNKM